MYSVYLNYNVHVYSVCMTVCMTQWKLPLAFFDKNVTACTLLIQIYQSFKFFYNTYCYSNLINGQWTDYTLCLLSTKKSFSAPNVKLRLHVLNATGMISKSCTFPFVVTTKESVPNSPLAALSTFSTSTTSRSGITTVTRSRTCKLGNNYIDGQN